MMKLEGDCPVSRADPIYGGLSLMEILVPWIKIEPI
jgi:hypothetical protein